MRPAQSEKAYAPITRQAPKDPGCLRDRKRSAKGDDIESLLDVAGIARHHHHIVKPEDPAGPGCLPRSALRPVEDRDHHVWTCDRYRNPWKPNPRTDVRERSRHVVDRPDERQRVGNVPIKDARGLPWPETTHRDRLVDQPRFESGERSPLLLGPFHLEPAGNAVEVLRCGHVCFTWNPAIHIADVSCETHGSCQMSSRLPLHRTFFRQARSTHSPGPCLSLLRAFSHRPRRRERPHDVVPHPLRTSAHHPCRPRHRG